MWDQLGPWLEMRARAVADAVSALALALGGALLRGWDIVRPSVVLALNVLAALILLFEEWGWRPLSNLIARLARYPLWAAAERWVAGLPPYGALLALGVPSAILVPAKLLGVYLLATGHLVTATAVIVAAKIASTALIARIFLLTKPALMQMPWFAHAYEIFVPWQEALFAHIRASWVWRYGRIVKWRVRNHVLSAWARLRPRLEEAWEQIAPGIERVRWRLRGAWRDLAARVAELRRPPRQLPPPARRR
jgi:hypothetical protein